MNHFTAIIRKRQEDASQEERVTLTVQGSLLTFKVHEPLRTMAPAVKRGVIKGFSRSARLRMFKYINRMDWEKSLPAIFVTLTYPDSYLGRSARQRGQDRYMFARWAETRLGRKIPYLWRCEWEPRQSGEHIGIHFAHLHMLMLGVRFLDKDEVREAWRRVIQAQGPLVTWIDGIWDGRKAGIYLAKYIAKKETDCVLDIAAYLNKSGRNWGTVRKGLINLHAEHVFIALTKQQIEWLRAEGNAALPWLDKRHKGSFCLMGGVAQRVLDEFRELSLTGPAEGI